MLILLLERFYDQLIYNVFIRTLNERTLSRIIDFYQFEINEKTAEQHLNYREINN